MHTLFIMEKYYHGPHFGFTNSTHNLIGSYECANIGTHEHVFIDQEDLWSDEAIDRVLLSYDFDLAFISSFAGRNATIDTVKKLHNSSKKIAMIWHDSTDLTVGCETRAPGYRWWEYAQYCTQIILDWGFGEVYPGAYAMMAPQDDRLYGIEGNTEEYDVGFPGRIMGFPDRERLIKKIKDSGINIITGGGRGPGYGNLSNEQYASVLKKSKICLHMCFRQFYIEGVVQRKGRTSEIASCGKFMLANFPEEFRQKKWDMLDCGHDYVLFDENNIIDKIQYYLENSDDRKTIANNLYQTYQHKYSPIQFWNNVCNYAGL